MILNKLVLLFMLISLTSCQTDTRVKVSAYYETLCPDSIAFIIDQLAPVYNAVPEILNVELIPFGKASFEIKDDGNVTFRCQHGPRECNGNMVQSCAINILENNMTTLVPFVKCMESQRRPDIAGPKCAEQLAIDFDPIRSCAEGADGQQRLLEMGRKTKALNPRMYFVPWININDEHTEEFQDGALSNLLRVVCEKYDGPSPPEACNKYKPREQLQGHTTTSSLVE